MNAPAFRAVEQHTGVVASAPPRPCGLPHHDLGRRVSFQRWDRASREWVSIYGTVLAHASRTLTIRTDDGTEITTSCGHVAAARTAGVV